MGRSEDSFVMPSFKAFSLGLRSCVHFLGSYYCSYVASEGYCYF